MTGYVYDTGWCNFPIKDRKKHQEEIHQGNPGLMIPNKIELNLVKVVRANIFVKKDVWWYLPKLWMQNAVWLSRPNPATAMPLENWFGFIIRV
jgi:hypothetical protein